MERRSPPKTPDPRATRPVLLAALATMAVGYAALFVATDPTRRQALLVWLLPDELFTAWCAGDVGSFSLLDRLPIVAGVIAIYVTAWLAGRLVLAALGVRQVLDRLERAVFALGVGLNLLSLFALTVGLAGGLQQRWVYFAAMAAVVMGNMGLWSWQRRGKAMAGGTPAPLRSDDDRRWWWLLVAALPFALAMLLGAMLPPWEYDVREYHLQVPKEWFRAGRIDFLPHNIYGNMPLGSELTALWGMALFRGDDAWWWGALVGKTAMAGYSLVTAAALVAFGRRMHSLAAGAVAAVVFLSTPWIVVVGQIGHNEGPVAMYVLLTLYALWLAGKGGWGCTEATPGSRGSLRDPQPPDMADQPPPKTADPLDATPRFARRFVILSGFLAGSAVACKYPPVLFLVVPLAAWILISRSGLPTRIWRRNTTAPGDSGPAGQAPTWRETAMHALLFLAAAAAGCGLWLGKNAVLAENPTYPLLYDVFGGRTRTPDKDRQWTRVHAPQPDAAGRRYSLAQLADRINLVTVRTPWASLALLPLAVAAWLVTLAGRASGGPSQRLLVAGTLWLAFVLAAWWLTTHRIDRFLVPVIPVVALAAGLGAVALPTRAWRSTTFALLAVSLLVHFPLVTQPSAGDTRFFAPLEALRRDVPEENRLPHERWYGHRVDPAHRWLNDHVPPGKRVLLVGDAQPFDLVPEAIYNTCFDDCQFTAIFRGRTRAERLAALQREKVTHVFIHWGELARFRSPGNYGYPSDYPTRELVHRELVAGQKLLRPIVLDDSANQATELFEVASE